MLVLVLPYPASASTCSSDSISNPSPATASIPYHSSATASSSGSTCALSPTSSSDLSSAIVVFVLVLGPLVDHALHAHPPSADLHLNQVTFPMHSTTLPFTSIGNAYNTLTI